MPLFRTWFLKKRRSIFYVSFGVCVLLLLVLNSYLFQALQFVQRPLVSLSTWTSNEYASVFGSSVKPDVYQKVVAERNQYAVEQSKMNALLSENEALKKELGFLNRRQLKGIPANILSRTVSSQTTTFRIDAGSDQKIVLGSAVIVEDGMFVGKITEVSQTQSIVTASTAQQMATGVTLFNETRTIGIAEGSTGNLIELKFVPSDEVIRVNDLVVTSGLEEHIPPGLVVGIINTVKPDPEAPFQNAILQPLVDVRTFSHVIILSPTDL